MWVKTKCLLGVTSILNVVKRALHEFASGKNASLRKVSKCVTTVCFRKFDNFRDSKKA